MKNRLLIFIVVFLGISSAQLSAQVSFTKGEIIKKSYASSTMTVAPVLGKSDNGFFILSSANMSAKRIVQLNLDNEMNQLGEEITLKLPKGKSVRRIFNIDNKMIVILRGKKSEPFEFYTYDAHSAQLGELILSVPVTEYPGSEDLEISLMNQDFDKYLSFNIRPRMEYAHVFRKVVLTNRELDKIVWTKVIEEPYLQAQEATGDYQLSDIYFNDAFTLVTRFTRPFLTEEKEQVQTNMYMFDRTSSSMRDAWFDNVVRSTTGHENSSLPMPYINNEGKVEVYFLTRDDESGTLDLVRGNFGGTEIERYALSAEVANLTEVNRIGIYGSVMPVNNEFENGSFCFLISEQLQQFELALLDSRSSHKHYVICFKRDESGVSEQHVVDAGYVEGFWGEFEDHIILSNSLDAIINGEMISTDEGSVFDQYSSTDKKIASGATFHYVLNGELYSFHSENSMGNMSSQLVKWKFN